METPEDRNPRRKSIGVQGSSFRGASTGGSSGGETRRYSIGTPSSLKSTGEEGDILPNYLRASTGSCHDFCKYGRKHAHLKPKSPIIPKRAAIVDKQKLIKTAAPVTKLKPSPDPKTRGPAEPIEIIKREIVLPFKKVEASKDDLSSSKKVTENNLKRLGTKISTTYVKQKPMTVNPSSMHDDSAGSNGGRKKKDIKTVKNTGMILKATGVKTVLSKTSTIGSLSPKPSVSRVVSLKAIKYRNPKVVPPLKDQNRMHKPDKDQDKTLHYVEAKNEFETVEMDYVSPSVEIIQSPSISMESINPTVSQRYESSSYKEVIEEETSITPISGSSQSTSNKEVLEEKLIYTNDDEGQSSYEDEVSEEECEYTDNDDAMETSEGNHNKLRRKSRVIISEGKDDEAIRLKFRRGKVLDLQSESNGPRRLKFRRGRIIDNNQNIQSSARRNFKKTFLEKETNNSNNGSESVVLKHQDVQGKKDGQGLFNNVIEETASKLVESRKSKVKALVGAFETVISLQDVRPSPS